MTQTVMVLVVSLGLSYHPCECHCVMDPPQPVHVVNEPSNLAIWLSVASLAISITFGVVELTRQ